MSGQNHHYLPRSILKAFGLGKQNQQIFFIDKNGDPKPKKTNIKNVACINNFYHFDSNNTSLEVKFFGPIDNKAPKILKKLLANINKRVLNENEEHNLRLYVASQITRVPFQYNNINNISNSFKNKISGKENIFHEGEKTFFLRSIIETTKIYQEIISNLYFRVFRVHKKPFILGDNPVMIFEHEGESISNNNSIPAINGKVFMMPVSPQDILIYYDAPLNNKLVDYAHSSNFWQFVNSAQYVFGQNDVLLEGALKEHYGYTYDYLQLTKPSIIEEYQLKRGDPVHIGQARYRFEGQALKQLKEFANQKTKV